MDFNELLNKACSGLPELEPPKVPAGPPDEGVVYRMSCKGVEFLIRFYPNIAILFPIGQIQRDSAFRAMSMVGASRFGRLKSLTNLLAGLGVKYGFRNHEGVTRCQSKDHYFPASWLGGQIITLVRDEVRLMLTDESKAEPAERYERFVRWRRDNELIRLEERPLNELLNNWPGDATIISKDENPR